MDLASWLQREMERDAHDGLPSTVRDPTALRLLALGITRATKPAVWPCEGLQPAGWDEGAQDSLQGHQNDG